MRLEANHGMDARTFGELCEAALAAQNAGPQHVQAFIDGLGAYWELTTFSSGMQGLVKVMVALAAYVERLGYTSVPSSDGVAKA